MIQNVRLLLAGNHIFAHMERRMQTKKEKCPKSQKKKEILRSKKSQRKSLIIIFHFKTTVIKELA